MIPITSPTLLGKALRQQRVRQNLTQQEAGLKFNLPQKTISNIERGLPGVHVNTLFRYLSALSLDMQLVPREQPSTRSALW